MINFEMARKLANDKVKEIEKGCDVDIKLVDDQTIEFEYGWMFFYQGVKYLETGDMGYMLGGNAPIIVDKYNSAIVVTGSARDIDFYIEKYSELRDDIDRFHKEKR